MKIINRQVSKFNKGIAGGKTENPTGPHKDSLIDFIQTKPNETQRNLGKPKEKQHQGKSDKTTQKKKITPENPSPHTKVKNRHGGLYEVLRK